MPETQSVVLFVVDGMRPDGLQQATTPNADRLVADGASTFSARTVMPSSTLPCHTSLFRGVPSERHGVTSNTWSPPVRPVPSVIDVVHWSGGATASFYNWEQLRDLADPGSLNASFYVDNCGEPDGDIVIAKAAAAHFGNGMPAFSFVYFGRTDIQGHDNGWMTAPYIDAIGTADEALGIVLSAIDDTTTVILTADHGGHDKTHGTMAPEDMTIPWIIRGPNTPAGHELQTQVQIIDTPATVCALLGIDPSDQWTGTVVSEAIGG
ncbi:MAG: alkaline phosphatase family protein [Candidatus Poribacteria bacterium]